jgi:putative toxin-antitoxin system antitoxin component (TIGR02293 family)
MATQHKNYETKLDESISSFVNENILMYSAKASESKISFTQLLDDKMLLIKVIRAGLPYSVFELISQTTPFNENNWADFLDISTKSLQRYKANANHHFKSIHTEKIIEVAEVTQLGLDVFGSAEKFKLWLTTPNFALGNLEPIDLLKDSYGKELVVSELIQINHGILV